MAGVGIDLDARVHNDRFVRSNGYDGRWGAENPMGPDALWLTECPRLTESLCEAGLEEHVFPIHAEAHALPYAEGFFDAAGTNPLLSVQEALEADGGEYLGFVRLVARRTA